MKIKDLKKFKLPDKSGIYLFKKNKDILYIGKATSLKDRVKSYFSSDLIATRGPMILDMMVQASSVDWQETDSVLEALILEAELIKKYQPKYNIKEKDDKSWNYVCITKDEIPKVIIVRGRELGRPLPDLPLLKGEEKYGSIFGPYTNGSQLKEAMKIIRRIFPYIDESSSKKSNAKFYEQINLSPTNLTQYKNNIKNLKLFFKGKKKSVIFNLKKEMMDFAKKKQFEKADEIKKRIFALNHINDVALIKKEVAQEIPFQKVLGSPRQSSLESRPDHFEKHFLEQLFRIEAYDVAHMSGKNMVGVMTVIENNEVQKSEYKKFKIRTQSGANDVGALTEMLERRFAHTGWQYPNLVVVDGNIAQINATKKVLAKMKMSIPIVGVVKDEKHKPKAIIGHGESISKYKSLILLANSEAHRFAIAYHKQKRAKNFLGN